MPARCVCTRRSREAAGWTLPAVGLLLLPKCPMCVAAWLALAGWTGASFAAASRLRETVLWLCAGALAWMAVRLVLQLRSPRPRS